MAELRSAELRTHADDGNDVVAWWGTIVECTSAIARRERTGAISSDDASSAFETLDRIADGWTQIPPGDDLRDGARRLVRIHDLRAADALQLSAARIASDGRPDTLPFVTLDDRLALAARREGFPVLPG